MDQWQFTAQTWAAIGPPLRPVPADLLPISAALAALAENPLIAVMGATTEYTRLALPAGSRLLAFDHSRPMLSEAWQGPPGSAVCADWRRLPLAPASVDLVLCDGGFCQLPWPQGQKEFAAAVARVLKPEALLITRLYVWPGQRESREQVLEALASARLGDLNQLKMRMWMAMQRSPEEGVTSGRFWELIRSAVPDPVRLGSLLGKEAEYLRQAEARTGMRKYHFATLAQLQKLFTREPGGFFMEALHLPDYPLGECCPTLVLRRHPGAFA